MQNAGGKVAKAFDVGAEILLKYSIVADTPVYSTPIHWGVRQDESRCCRLRACATASPLASPAGVATASASSGLGGGAAGENGVEMGESVAFDLAVGFFSGAELGDGAHFV